MNCLRYMNCRTRALASTAIFVGLTHFAIACIPKAASSLPANNPSLKRAVVNSETASSVSHEVPTGAATRLLTYDGRNEDNPTFRNPIVTKFPKTTAVSVIRSDAGVSVSFTFGSQYDGPDGIEMLTIRLPSNAAIAEEIEAAYTQAGDFLNRRGWQLEDVQTVPDSATFAPGYPEFAYPWLQQVIAYRTKTNQPRFRLIGKIDQQAIHVFLSAPGDFDGDFFFEYLATVEAVLLNLELAPEQLPDGSTNS